MIKEPITYTDYNGVERTEDFYFNISKAELIEMEMMTDGGMQQYLEEISKSKDNKRIMQAFKEIITKAYGVKSPDGRRFIKNAEVTDAFLQSEAYSELIVKLATDADYALKFVSGTFNVPAGTKLPDVTVR